MKSKIDVIPISLYTLNKKKLGKGSVPCVDSNRWLQYPPKSWGVFTHGEYITLKVMTKGKNKEDKMICNLVVTREDLLDAINSTERHIEG